MEVFFETDYLCVDSDKMKLKSTMKHLWREEIKNQLVITLEQS